MTWAFRRRLLYLSAVFGFFFVILSVPAFMYFNDPATCFDGKKNQGEVEKDCGGPCQLMCRSQITDPTVLWARSFEIAPGVYSALAYIDNPNFTAGLKQTSYRFRIVDDSNVLIAERHGVTYISPNGITPIFEGGIVTGDRVPVRTYFDLLDEDLEWYVMADRTSAIEAGQAQLVDPLGSPKVTATIENTTLETFRNIDVVAALFGVDGNVVTASKTYVSELGKREVADLVFTWPYPLEEEIARIEVISHIVPQ
jgi:hypothetical protein